MPFSPKDGEIEGWITREGKPNKTTANNFTCPNCKTILSPEQIFCPDCGRKADLVMEQDKVLAINQYNASVLSPKKKNLLWLYILLPILLVLGIVIYVAIQHYEKVAIEQYTTDAKNFGLMAIVAGANLEGIGNAVQNNWHTYIYNNYYSGFSSINDAVNSALIKKASEISEAKTHRETLGALYSKLKSPPKNNPNLIDMRDAVRDLYNAYTEFHDCVTNPKGNYFSFMASFQARDHALSSKHDALEKILNK